VGLVVEYQREEGALDAFQWYCDECDKMIHEVTLDLENIVTQLPPLFEAYWNSLDARTCESCGAVQEKP
jgi:3-hydroxyanthranilate 3,4-dioxygenase